MALNPNVHTMLKRIHESAKATGKMHINPQSPVVASLIRDGYLSHNPQDVDPTDSRKSAVSLTDQGHSAVGGEPTAPAITPPQPAQPSFPEAGEPSTETEEDNTAVSETAAVKTRKPRTPKAPATIMASGSRMALPEAAARTRGVRTETYPFSKIAEPNEEGLDSFFVEATADLPQPAKALASTVSSANKRFKDTGRTFKIVAVTNDPEFKKDGARVFRTA